MAKGYFLLSQPCATAGTHLPLTLLLLICSWVRGSTPTNASLLPLSLLNRLLLQMSRRTCLLHHQDNQSFSHLLFAKPTNVRNSGWLAFTHESLDCLLCDSLVGRACCSGRANDYQLAAVTWKGLFLSLWNFPTRLYLGILLVAGMFFYYFITRGNLHPIT
jgi:hypothetical protein